MDNVTRAFPSPPASGPLSIDPCLIQADVFLEISRAKSMQMVAMGDDLLHQVWTAPDEGDNNESGMPFCIFMPFISNVRTCVFALCFFFLI